MKLIWINEWLYMIQKLKMVHNLSIFSFENVLTEIMI
jgi:hypothetical protein